MRKSILLSLCLLFFGAACASVGPKTDKLTKDNLRIVGNIENLEREIASSRQAMVGLDAQISKIYGELEKTADKSFGRREHVHLELASADILQVVKKAFDQLEGSAPDFKFKLTKVDGRVHRERLFISTSYDIQINSDPCSGSAHGHLYHLERLLLKTSDMSVVCETGGAVGYADLAAAIPPISLPLVLHPSTVFGREEHAALTRKEKNVDLTIPLQIKFEGNRIVLISQVITIQK